MFKEVLILFLRLDLFAQISESVERLEERFVLFGEMQADEVVDRLAEKARAGYGTDADFARQVFAEGKVGFVAEFGDVQQDVIRALRLRVYKPEVVQSPQEQVPFFRVGVLQLFVIVVAEAQSGDSCLLQRSSGADGQEVMDFLRRIGDMCRCDDVAQPPARDGIGFGERRTGNRPLPHSLEGSEVHMPVRLVDD